MDGKLVETLIGISFKECFELQKHLGKKTAIKPSKLRITWGKIQNQSHCHDHRKSYTTFSANVVMYHTLANQSKSHRISIGCESLFCEKILQNQPEIIVEIFDQSYLRFEGN